MPASARSIISPAAATPESIIVSVRPSFPSNDPLEIARRRLLQQHLEPVRALQIFAVLGAIKTFIKLLLSVLTIFVGGLTLIYWLLL